MAVEYLVNTANLMYVLLSKDQPTATDLAQAARLGCDTLTRLAQDHDFEGYSRELRARQSAHRLLFDDVTGRATNSLEHFSYFLEAERRILVSNGMYTGLVDLLMQRAKELIDSIRRWDGDYEAFRVMVIQVQQDACRLSASLKQHQEDVQRREAARTMLIRVMYAVTGGVVIALNVASPLTLSVVGTAVSGAVGGALISSAVPPVS